MHFNLLFPFTTFCKLKLTSCSLGCYRPVCNSRDVVHVQKSVPNYSIIIVHSCLLRLIHWGVLCGFHLSACSADV